MQVEEKCVCYKTCCDNPEIYTFGNPKDSDEYYGGNMCANCNASCYCNM